MVKLMREKPNISFLKTEKEWLNIGETAKFLGVARSTVGIWRAENDDFPTPMKLSSKKINFNRDELLDWAKTRMKVVDQEGKQ